MLDRKQKSDVVNSSDKKNQSPSLNHSHHSPTCRFLRWICPPHLIEGIEGDLQEAFAADVETLGERKARVRFVLNALRFCRPGIVLRNKFSIRLIQSYMLGNYVKIMLRSMMKRKVYSTINVLGLTVGISFALMAGVFIYGELQTNQQLTDVDRLYNIESNSLESNNGIPFFAPSPVARAVKDQYPALVENYYRFSDRNITVSKGDKHHRVQGMIGDTTFLQMFGFPLRYGEARSALAGPHSILITEKIAIQYFGKTDVLGETLTLTTEMAGDQEYVVTGVLENLKPNSVTNLLDMNAQIVLPIQALKEFNAFDPEQWSGAQMISYVKFAAGASEESVKDAFRKILDKDAPDQLKGKIALSLAGLDDYHLLTNHSTVLKLVMTLSIIVGFILLLAVINFINITMGNSVTRLKEIGVRKTIGGVSKQVMIQFLSESVSITLIATLLSLLVYELLRSYVGELLGATFPSLTNLPFAFWKALVIVMIVTGVLAGAYPAFHLSSYKTIESLKGKLKAIKGGAIFSRSLIGVQFFLVMCVFIFSIVITRQVSFFMDKDLGYDKSAVVTMLSVPRLWTPEGLNKMEAAKKEFLQIPQIEAATLSWDIPNGNFGIVAEFYKEGGDLEKAESMTVLVTDEDYTNTFHIAVTEGSFFRNVSDSSQADRIVINESAAKMLGASAGDKVLVKGLNSPYTVIGVVKDFNFFSLHQQMKPLVFLHTRNNLTLAFRYFTFKLKPGDLQASMDAIQIRWNEIFPGAPFEYSFMDQTLEKLYKTELKLRKAAGVATVLMLIIVLLGVFGLVSLHVAKRTKEIGIRKVLGATISNILTLISRDFVGLMIAAFVVSVPVSFYFVKEWLSSFAYQVDIQWWMFVAPGILVFLLSLMVVFGQSWRAIRMNPAESLKNE